MAYFAFRKNIHTINYWKRDERCGGENFFWIDSWRAQFWTGVSPKNEKISEQRIGGQGLGTTRKY